MGLINFGVPKKEVEYLKKNMKLDVFVEGGTYKGGTAKSMSGKFKKVYTIEKSDVMYDIAKENLKDSPNITMLKGDTREHLHNILKDNDNLIFWLDAHWSGGDTYGEEDECPLIEELEIIFQYPSKNQVILIDDARLFMAPPPLPHKFQNWQTLVDIVKVMPREWDLIEYEDVIYLFPLAIADKFKEFLQIEITDKLEKNKTSLFQKVIQKLGLINC